VGPAGGGREVRRGRLTNLRAVTNRHPPRVLSIAGSDSGGGAGIQADLKAFAACGAHGMTAITAITVQNTVGVTGVHHVPAEVIVAQVTAVAEDIGLDAIKIGMLGRVETIEAVEAALDALPVEVPVVIDPVMVAESGAQLLEPEARMALVERLFPRATVVTPNLPEARAIAGAGDRGDAVERRDELGARDEMQGLVGPRDEAEGLARAIHPLGPTHVVVTGGHRQVTSDLFFDGRRVVEITGERYPDGAAHGSGCTHSSVLAARLAWGDDPLTAARVAKQMAARAVADGLRGIGRGAGPVNVLGIGHLHGADGDVEVDKDSGDPYLPPRRS
jgi:hydroxymethylpyrimidine/phosphomethylpyrimidine kinase